MVQAIRPGQPQVTATTQTQGSLFGNGQSEALGGVSPTKRDPKAEEERAKNKFAKTNAGKQQATTKAKVTINQTSDDARPREATKPTSPPKPLPPPKPPCHHTHPPYVVKDGFTVIGGSGINPHNKSCDIYCSLDYAGLVSMPWETEGPYCFVFEIKNYGVPNNVDAFKKLINWLEIQIYKGRKVHVGCMAGHGRTGMVLAALRMQMSGDKDAIMHVRNNYCDQAVETDGQVKWLMEHYGMNTAPPRVKRSYAAPAVSASEAGAVRHGNWDEPFGDFDSANTGRYDNIPREPQHTSWVANSPWLKELEGQPANLGDDAWYNEGK